MLRTEVIEIFNATNLAKNASTVSEAQYLGKCGCGTRYWGDVLASLGGMATITYEVGNTAENSFYTPGNATACCINHETGNRERYELTLMGTPWIKFKAKEQNASPLLLDFDLIIAR